MKANFTNAGITYSASAGQPPRTETQLSSELRQAIWEASQFKSVEALRDFCEAVIREIESDEP